MSSVETQGPLLSAGTKIAVAQNLSVKENLFCTARISHVGWISMHWQLPLRGPVKSHHALHITIQSSTKEGLLVLIQESDPEYWFGHHKQRLRTIIASRRRTR